MGSSARSEPSEGVEQKGRPSWEALGSATTPLGPVAAVVVAALAVSALPLPLTPRPQLPPPPPPAGWVNPTAGEAVSPSRTPSLPAVASRTHWSKRFFRNRLWMRITRDTLTPGAAPSPDTVLCVSHQKVGRVFVFNVCYILFLRPVLRFRLCEVIYGGKTSGGSVLFLTYSAGSLGTAVRITFDSCFFSHYTACYFLPTNN